MTEKNPAISVIMPAWNAEKYIRESIDSVVNQSFSDWELIVIDDCGDDSTVEIVNDYARNDSRIKLLHTPSNQGVAKARNLGVSAAAGDWVAFLDSDDLWAPEKLELQSRRIAETDAQIIYSSYDFIDSEGKPFGQPFLVPETTNWNEMLGCNYVGCSTALIPTVLAKAHPFNCDFYHEDYLLWMQLLATDVKAAGCKEVLMHYRVSNESRSFDKRNAAKQRWDIYRKGLGLGLMQSTIAFVKYAITGVMKHR